MKKIILIALIAAFAMNAKAQITLEHVYDSASTFKDNQLMMINFAVSGEEYVKINNKGKAIEIYDMSHSLIKSISYAGFPQAVSFPTILYLSQNLFTTDSKIAFMYVYDNIISTYDTWHTLIYNEDGTLIFQADSMCPMEQDNTPQEQYEIYNTPNGTKMILSKQFNDTANVYSLPGTLTTSIQEENNNLLALQKQGSIANPYPNPTNNTTKIDYELPPGINEGEIVFYNLQGAEVKRFKVDRTFNTLLISTNDLAAGTYLYQLQTSAQSSEGKKMIVIK